MAEAATRSLAELMGGVMEVSKSSKAETALGDSKMEDEPTPQEDSAAGAVSETPPAPADSSQTEMESREAVPRHLRM